MVMLKIVLKLKKKKQKTVRQICIKKVERISNYNNGDPDVRVVRFLKFHAIFPVQGLS